MRGMLGGLALAMMTVVLAASPAQAKVKVGQAAPPFTVTTFDKVQISSDQLQGKVIVLNYWATWCAPCKQEMLVFERYVRSHPRSDVRIYAIATEHSIPEAKLKPLAAALSFPLISKLSARGLGVMQGVPTSYVIDRRGVVRHAKAGAFQDANFAALMTELLAEPGPEGATVTAQRAP